MNGSLMDMCGYKVRDGTWWGKARRRVQDGADGENPRARWFDGWINGVQTRKQRVVIHPWICVKPKSEQQGPQGGSVPMRPHYDNITKRLVT